MDALRKAIPPAQSVTRPEGAMLAHALGNAVAVLHFELENLERQHFDEEKFKAAYESMSDEIGLLRDLVVRASRLLNGPSYTLTAHSIIEPSPDNTRSAPLASSTIPTFSATLTHPPIQVICVDDNVDITAGLRLIIDAQPDMQCEGCLASADDLEAAVCELAAGRADGAPLIVLLDATMPGKDPLFVTQQLKARNAQARVIIYSGYDDHTFLDRIAAAGACGAVSKNDQPAAVLRVIREVAAGRLSWPSNHSPCNHSGS